MALTGGFGDAKYAQDFDLWRRCLVLIDGAKAGQTDTRGSVTVVEMNKPEAFFKNPQHERTKLFLSQILH